MNRRGTEPYARWCGRTAGAIPPPTRCINYNWNTTKMPIAYGIVKSLAHKVCNIKDLKISKKGERFQYPNADFRAEFRNDYHQGQFDDSTSVKHL